MERPPFPPLPSPPLPTSKTPDASAEGDMLLMGQLFLYFMIIMMMMMTTTMTLATVQEHLRCARSCVKDFKHSGETGITTTFIVIAILQRHRELK